MPRRLKERFSARLVALGVFAALAPVAAQAQTNIDEGKSPSQMYAEVCATCHKAPRGLANGRNSGALAGFLAEHYTSSRQQAAALAAYVLGAGGASGTAARAPEKPEGAARSERARAAEEPKAKGRPVRQSAKPEDEAPSTARLQHPAEEAKPEAGAEAKPESKPEAEPSADANAGEAPAAAPTSPTHEGRPVTASRGGRKRGVEPGHPAEPAVTTSSPAETPPPAASAAIAAPASAEAAGPEAGAPAKVQEASPPTGETAASSPSATIAPAAPVEVQPSETVPRDDIPD